MQQKCEDEHSHGRAWVGDDMKEHERWPGDGGFCHFLCLIWNFKKNIIKILHCENNWTDYLVEKGLNFQKDRSYCWMFQ